MDMHLYPQIKVKGQSFEGQPVLTVPNQSLSLKEILERFVRREALPVMKQGVYNTQLGDLEKLANEDITVQMERVQELKENIANAQNRMKAVEEARVKEALEAKLKAELAEKAVTPTPSGS